MRGLAEVTTIPNLTGQPQAAPTSSVMGQIYIEQTQAGMMLTPMVYGIRQVAYPMQDLQQAVAQAADIAASRGAQLSNLRPWGSMGIVYDLIPGNSRGVSGLGDILPPTGAYGPGGGYGGPGGAYNPAKSPVTLPGGEAGQYVTWGTPGGPANPRGPFAFTPVLPDSVLPPALQRNSPLQQPYPFVPNSHDSALMQEAALWTYIAKNGGLKSCCRIPELGAPIWDQPPWQVMPSQGLPITRMYPGNTTTISGGPPYNGKDTVIGEFRVPIGWDGVLNRFVTYFAGTGFKDFDGSVAYRVRVNARYAQDWGNVINTYGTFGDPFSIPGVNAMRIISGQTVQVIVAIPAGSNASGQAQAGVFGWIYPRR